MRGNRLWIWLVGILLWGVLVPAAASANGSMRQVLVVHSGDYPEVEHVRAELLALKFRVTLLNNHQPISAPALLEQAAREMDASVAIEFVVVADALQVWLYDAARGSAPSVQQFRRDTVNSESDRVEALRVVEYLRAALIRAETRAEPVAEVVAPGNPVAAPAAEEAPRPAPPKLQKRQNGAVRRQAVPVSLPPPPPTVESVSVNLVRPASFWLTVAPGVAALGFSVVMPTGAAGIVWQMTSQFAVVAEVLLPLGNTQLASAMGSTDTKALGGLGMARYNLAHKGSAWRPTLGGGVSAIWLDTKREVDPSVRAWTELGVIAPAPTLEFALHWQPFESWSFFASILAAYSIRESGYPELDRLGRPAMFYSSIGVEWRAVVVGSRD